ncbi:phosphatase PAP2 family protein [Hymenobacter sp. DG25A]|uniref:phosphatase PAP2 family protein n=1 Tax=Hymenobacter sp. DG25A TaxID=1385663 RepID=UPI0012FC5379|nr:phosphatase PAP2 family protein [Hymenobacter sp. DG25A]
MTSPQILEKVKHWLRRHQTVIGLYVLGLLVPWMLFIDLAEDVWKGEGFAWDHIILDWLQAHRHPALDNQAVFLSHLGGTGAMGALTLAIVGGHLLVGARWRAVLMATAMAGAWLLNLWSKALTARIRPLEWIPLVEEPPVPAMRFSFPSGHAMFAAALATALCVLLWPTRWRWQVLIIGAFWAGVIGLARVYLGAHYPSDVVAGWLGSIGWVIGLYLLFFRPAQKQQARNELRTMH